LPGGRIFWHATAAFVLASATLASLLFTEDGYGYALDEATYRWVAQEAREWSDGLGKPSLRESLSRARIESKLHFLEPPGSRPNQPHSNFNLPASIHVLNLGWALGGWRGHELSRLRFGSELLFALSVGGLVWRLATRDGLVPAVGAGLGIALSPRVFGHAHLAATETALVCFWLWAIIAIVEAAERRGTVVASAISVGLLAATKLTAWPACALMVLWAVSVGKDRRLALAFWLIAGSAAVVVLLTPNLWHDPVGGLQRYMRQASGNPWKIAAYFGGRTYTEGMPWWSGLATLVATTPVVILALAAASLTRVRRDRLTQLLWLNVVLLMAMRTAGAVPAHDGERQFLPVLAMLGMLAGIQTGRLVESLARFHRAWAATAGLLIAAEPVVEGWIYREHGLMYYNRAVGGLAGAEKLGFEVSYWLEAMTEEEWKRLLDPLPRESKVFLRPDHPGWPELMRWGVIPRHVSLADAPEQADHYLLYAKKAAYWVPAPDGKAMQPTDLAVMQAAAPAPRETRIQGVRAASLHPRR
jgi:hypothetical protein